MLTTVIPTTPAPKTTNLLKFCVLHIFCLHYLSKVFPAKNTVFALKLQASAKKNPPAGGKPSVRNPHYYGAHLTHRHVKKGQDTAPDKVCEQTVQVAIRFDDKYLKNSWMCIFSC